MFPQSKNQLLKAAKNNETWILNDPSLGKIIKADFGKHDQLMVYGSTFFSKQKEISSKHASAPIYELKSNYQTFGEYARNLVSESYTVFQPFQVDNEESGKNEFQRKHFYRTSLSYRAILSLRIFEIQNVLEKNQNNENLQYLSQQKDLFYMLELIWHFCEIIFIDPQPGGKLLSTLINWIQLHFKLPQDEIEHLLKSVNPEEEPNYWTLINKNLLQGKLMQAKRLLKLHPRANEDEFMFIDELLDKMPIFYPASMSLPEFGLAWHHWHNECERCLDEDIFYRNPQLEEICQILAGKTEAFIDKKDLCENWYHFMISILLYTNPCVKAIELQYKAKEYINLFEGTSKLSIFEQILVSAMEFDLEKVVQLSCELEDCWWFATHFSNLIYKKQQLRDSIPIGLYEFILQNYADILLSHGSLWQLGIEYLKCCPNISSELLEMYLERIPLESDSMASKVITIAQQNELPNVQQSVCKIMGLRYLKNNMLESAVKWTTKSQDPKQAAYLADKLLNEYCENDNIECLELLDNLGPSYLMSEKLAFLSKYREFHQLYKAEDLKSAAALLVSLISMKLAPRKFWPTLFLDAIPLLESKEPIFTNHQTFELLFALEELTSYKPQPLPVTEIEKKIDINLFRIVLSRNLSRSIISEATTTL